mmetsp:Transcript_5676/g.8366  ORF Transcript_5676/g.8366 Transcript_5676/m.8366 type:complete len:729 (+) Transcript_5676:1888-4074(+)|eukprot:CAMPEP_0167759224 /NCGR_PEP_ID=MMETSP0110_2-20121227/10903_1 /TAXON_ID=629695 /ORGANISM="Gymnochlora sp., Strain CCMP2014" /LENGTH=728 /DNA_ID=CAMNT_0007645583 /DNA_START=2079 /DNA_END=4265 /DNA_ORIENTATION=+
MSSLALNRIDRIGQHLGLQLQATAASKNLVDYQLINGVAVLTLRSPPVNSFSPAMFHSIKAAVTRALDDSSAKGIVITGAGRFFMAGADIPNLMKMAQNPDKVRITTDELQRTHELLNVIENGAKPTVAAVNGPALGGGLELAMSCNARIGLKSSLYGLPELKLGIIPGFGGTQRLPRLIGVAPAVKITLSGKPVQAKQALKMGLISQLVKSPKDLIPSAVKLVLAIADGKVPRRSALEGKIGSIQDAQDAIDMARVKARRKAKGTPHAAAYLDAVEAGIKQGGRKGIKAEIDAFIKCISSPSAEGLIHMFLASKLAPKVPELKGIKPGKIRTVAVLGGGTMGAGIVGLLLMRGYRVILKEINEKVLYAGVQRVIKTLESTIRKLKLPPQVLEMGMRNFVPTTDYSKFKEVDLVIEAIVENPKIKRKVFADLERVCRPDCILGTNTSTIDINVVGQDTKAQDRIIGLHFFSPAHIMPLLEIIRTKSTSKQTLATCISFGKRIGKTCVTVGNCVGFTANRIFFPYGGSCGFLVDHGICPYRIDKILREEVQMPMGAHEMSDLSGIDIGVHVHNLCKEAYGDRVYLSSIGALMYKTKRYGQKTGIGYYKYAGRKGTPDAKGLAPILKEARKGKIQMKLTDTEIMEAVMYPLVNESYRVVAEGHVIRVSDIDIVSIMGFGFPSHKGGLMFWAKKQGLKHIVQRLQHYSKIFPGMEKFYEPSELLLKEASRA